MPFCPLCKSEYREGFTRCADCDCELVEKLPQSADMHKNAGKPDKKEKVCDKPDCEDNSKDVLLVSGSSNIDCASIEGALESAGIPYFKVNRETGAYMNVVMGYSVYGADYYVKESVLEKSKQILDDTLVPGGMGMSGDMPLQEDEQIAEKAEQAEVDSKDEYERPHKIMRRIFAVLALLLVTNIIGIIVFVLYRLFSGQ